MSAVEATGRFFLDTNIFVYSFDASSPEKQQISRQLVTTALTSQRGSISTQVVQEFVNIALRRFTRPFAIGDIRAYLTTVFVPLCLHYLSMAYYAQALIVQAETGYSWYDALIVTAALELGCDTLFTEDLQSNRRIRGLMIVNPYGLRQ